DNSIDTTPTIMGTTGSGGLMKLPNRKVDEVRTLNGYHRTPNPFGNVNVVGARGLMLARVTKAERTTWFWLELTDFLTAVYRGESDRFVLPLKTDWPSIDSPLPPRNVKAEWIDNDHVKLTWDAPAVLNEQHYLENPGGYRVYRRIGDNGLNDRPWFPVATLNPATRECVLDLKQFPEDTYWFTQVNRFGVSSIGALGIESGIVSLMEPKKP
ncbi:MAG TPA: fibronectin type III domain-containing protein, partial [Armatimonadota bacterium]|nr:fibronectin type III domain-containing protein [Armatimonadota bacterium]